MTKHLGVIRAFPSLGGKSVCVSHACGQSDVVGGKRLSHRATLCRRAVGWTTLRILASTKCRNIDSNLH